MDLEAVQPPGLPRRAAKPAPAEKPPKPRRKRSVNALMGIALWFLLWGGYNTDLSHLSSPGFPTSTLDLIHGVRALFPILAAWFALMLIFARASRLLGWLIGPMGMILLYSVIGLASSATLSIDPLNALYYGFNYLAIVLILLAIALVADPLPDLLQVHRFSLGVGMLLTLSLLGAIPVLGGQVIIPTDTPTGIRTYSGAGSIMGMAATRNTGFARYAAISALAVLPGLLRKGPRLARLVYGALFLASFYALILANGRTEIVAFIASLVIFFATQRAMRSVYLLAGIGGAIVLGLRGFYHEFYLYFTRGKGIDLTLTGRTIVWQRGWHLFWQSPWVGLGFQADRYYMDGWHMHNAFLHSLVQSGVLGALPIIMGLAIIWYYIIYYFFLHQPADKSLIPAEMPAIFLFTTISSMTESTFAYYSAAWMLSAPIVPYVVALHRHLRRISLRTAQERTLRLRLERRQARVILPQMEVPPSPAGK